MKHAEFKLINTKPLPTDFEWVSKAIPVEVCGSCKCAHWTGKREMWLPEGESTMYHRLFPKGMTVKERGMLTRTQIGTLIQLDVWQIRVISMTFMLCPGYSTEATQWMVQSHYPHDHWSLKNPCVLVIEQRVDSTTTSTPRSQPKHNEPNRVLSAGEEAALRMSGETYHEEASQKLHNLESGILSQVCSMWAFDIIPKFTRF